MVRPISRLVLLCVIWLTLNPLTTVSAEASLRPEGDFADEYVMFNAYFHDDSKKFKRESLDLFAKTLNDRPGETGYIVSYGSWKTLNCESLENLKMIRSYLVN